MRCSSLGDFEFDGSCRREVRPGRGGLGDRFDYFGMRVAQRQRAESHHPVDVLVAIDVVNARATASLHEHGILAEVRRAAGGGTAGLDQHA